MAEVTVRKLSIDYKTAFGYAFIHFAMEVLCFFFLYRVFEGSRIWWGIAIMYDAIAFAGQVPVGAFCEKHPRFRPGVCGAVMLVAGAAAGLAAAGFPASGADEGKRIISEGIVNAESALSSGGNISGFVYAVIIAGFCILSVGNALLHISGALVTLKASEGRLSESGIFVGGGAFGVITGRLLGSGNGSVLIPFVLMAAALAVVILIDIKMLKKPAADNLCLHNIAANRPVAAVITVLACVVAVRSYISGGIPLQWKTTVFETVMLFAAMGIGKMAGGVLADLFGARLIGILSCLLSIPFLLAGGNLMWVSLIGIALFSMTMAIALGGIVSVIPNNPGVAFGITTLALFLGSLPTFFVNMPDQGIMNIILAVLSVLSAAGIWYSTDNTTKKGV